MPKSAAPARLIVVIARPAGRTHEYLLLRKRRGGYWQPVAGNLDPGDLARRKPQLAGLRRELAEETGLKAGRILRLGRVDRPHKGRQPTPWAAQVYLKQVKRDVPIRLSREHTGLKWAKPRAALKAVRHSVRFTAALRLAASKLAR